MRPLSKDSHPDLLGEPSRPSPAASGSLGENLLSSITVIILVSWAAYFTALHNGFVFDDIYQIIRNPWIRDIKYLPEIFSKQVWGFKEGIVGNYYRPLMHVIYMINYHAFGLRPLGFHIVSIIFHSGVSVMVYIIMLEFVKMARASTPLSPSLRGETAKRYGNKISPPFIAALVFATHPIHTEAVTWAAGIPEVSFTFFYLLSFYSYIRASTSESSSWRPLLLSAALFCLAILCKETALTLPFMLLAYDYAAGKMKDPLPGHLKRYIPYLLIICAYFALRFHALGGIAPHMRHADLGVYRLILNIFALFEQYIEKLLVPVNLNVFYIFHPISSLFEARGIFSLIVTGLFIVLVAASARRKKQIVLLGLLFMAVPLLPVLYIPVLGENVFAERYLYLPSVGFAVLSSLVLSGSLFARRYLSLTMIAIAAIVIGAYFLGTMKRNMVWKSDYTLFSDTVSKSPGAATPRLGLGGALINEGRIDEAIEQLRISIALDPDSELSHYNLGLAFSKKGMLEDEIKEMEIALKIDPRHAEAHNSLGTAYLATGRRDKAIEHFGIAIRLQPENAEAYNNIGIFYGDLGIMDKAIYYFETAVRLSPDHPGFRANLQRAYKQESDKRAGR